MMPAQRPQGLDVFQVSSFLKEPWKDSAAFSRMAAAHSHRHGRRQPPAWQKTARIKLSGWPHAFIAVKHNRHGPARLTRQRAVRRSWAHGERGSRGPPCFLSTYVTGSCRRRSRVTRSSRGAASPSLKSSRLRLNFLLTAAPHRNGRGGHTQQGIARYYGSVELNFLLCAGGHGKEGMAVKVDPAAPCTAGRWGAHARRGPWPKGLRRERGPNRFLEPESNLLARWLPGPRSAPRHRTEAAPSAGGQRQCCSASTLARAHLDRTLRPQTLCLRAPLRRRAPAAPPRTPPRP